MGKIMWSRVVLGGLMAGVGLIVLAPVLTMLFIGQQELQAAIQAFHPLQGGIYAPLCLAITFFFLGILAVWWYAAIRSRFGPGWKTAIIAGFAVWLTANPAQSLLLARVARLPIAFVLKSTAIYLIIIIASTVLGAWLYKEEA